MILFFRKILCWVHFTLFLFYLKNETLLSQYYPRVKLFLSTDSKVSFGITYKWCDIVSRAHGAKWCKVLQLVWAELCPSTFPGSAGCGFRLPCWWSFMCRHHSSICGLPRSSQALSQCDVTEILLKAALKPHGYGCLGVFRWCCWRQLKIQASWLWNVFILWKNKQSRYIYKFKSRQL